MLNKVIIIGRLTKDVELHSTPNGGERCCFTLAVERNYQSGSERQADFINCVAWRQTAEFISRYFRKGNLLCVEGSIQTRSWDGDDGKKRYATEVVVVKAYFCEGNKDNAEGKMQNAESGGEYGSLGEPLGYTKDDDLPF